MNENTVTRFNRKLGVNTIMLFDGKMWWVVEVPDWIYKRAAARGRRHLTGTAYRGKFVSSHEIQKEFRIWLVQMLNFQMKRAK